MSPEDLELLRLYDAQAKAYANFVSISNGDNLVGNQRISPTELATARAEWLDLYSELRASPGWSNEHIRELLVQRAGEAEEAK